MFFVPSQEDSQVNDKLFCHHNDHQYRWNVSTQDVSSLMRWKRYKRLKHKKLDAPVYQHTCYNVYPCFSIPPSQKGYTKKSQKTKAKEAAWTQPSQWTCFSVYPKTYDKQEYKGACTNAPEDISLLDPSTSSLSPVLSIIQCFRNKISSTLSSKN